jgi:transposase
MNKDKYVGMDVDKATIVAHVTNAKGEFLMETFLEPKAEAIRQFLRGLEGRVHVAFEEGCMATWLYDVIQPVVAKTVVCDPRWNKLIQTGNKGDRRDAANLTRLLRLGELKSVYHSKTSMRGMKELVYGYDRLVRDTTRIMNRLKGLFRGQAIGCSGRGIYNLETQDEWTQKLEGDALRARARLLYKELEALKKLKEEAEEAMLEEAQKHRSYKLLKRVSGLGPIRSAMIIAVVVTPHRFRTKRQYWGYCGFAVTTHNSSEYEIINGQRQRRKKKPVQTRGLNENFNRMLKSVYKGAVMSAIATEPFKKYYQRLIDNKMRPEMARLTVARKIAAISLAVWKKGERFDPTRVNQAEENAGDGDQA